MLNFQSYFKFNRFHIGQILSPEEFQNYRKSNRLVILGVIIDTLVLALLVPLLSILASGESIKLHQYWGPLYQMLGLKSQHSFLLLLVSVLLLLFITKNLFSIYITNQQAKLAHQISGNISKRMFENYYHTSFQLLKQNEKAKLITKIMFVPTAFGSGILLPYGIFLSEIILLGMIITGLALFKPYLFLLLLFTLGPIMILIYRGLKNKMHHLGNQRNTASTLTYEKLNEAFEGWQEATLMNKEKFFFNHYFQYQTKVNQSDSLLFTYSSIPHKIIELAAILGLAAIIIFAMMADFGNNRLLYHLGLFAAAAFRMIPSINRISSAVLKLKNYQYTFDELIPYNQLNHSNHSNLVPFENIQLININFKYEQSNINTLNKINIQFNKGDIIGIKGQSGCGKTTLINILAGLYQPSSGEIIVNNQANNRQKLNIAIVKQDTFIYNGSLIENIILKDNPNDDELQTASKLISWLNLEDLSKELSSRTDTSVGEMGSRLSGGQKQRLSLARALFNQPQILLLDEATNALDKETEKKIFDYLLELNRTQQLTLVIVSHHQEVLQYASKIIDLN